MAAIAPDAAHLLAKAGLVVKNKNVSLKTEMDAQARVREDVGSLDGQPPSGGEFAGMTTVLAEP